MHPTDTQVTTNGEISESLRSAASEIQCSWDRGALAAAASLLSSSALAATWMHKLPKKLRCQWIAADGQLLLWEGAWQLPQPLEVVKFAAVEIICKEYENFMQLS